MERTSGWGNSLSPLVEEVVSTLVDAQNKRERTEGEQDDRPTSRKLLHISVPISQVNLFTCI